MTPTLAGRDGGRLRALAEELVLPYRIFDLDDTEALDTAVEATQLVLHCAGPFVRTAAPMVDACLRTGTDYLDITGEIDVFERIAARDDEAQAADTMLLPGVGFDVVPTDCLAAYLHQQLPDAVQVELAIFGRGGISRGTATTAIEQLGEGGVIRRDGVLQPVPTGWRTRSVDFGGGPVDVITIPWGDVATAYYSTGIPNVTTYMRFPDWVQQVMHWGGRWADRLPVAPARQLLKRRVQRGDPGPTAEERERGESVVWGEVMNEAGECATARLHGPETYDFTVEAALAVVERILNGSRPSGFQTPSSAFGPDFVLAIDGVTRTPLH
jgi:saccharopine dehydrogenase (NAD+, L-lysine-forming)